ncbi:MAG TPA: addiction module protein [Polyangiaceae bacterium]|jgi:putative addiction module component (TIGR02574 family)|nr:addiction module protein [Polyangiaceae bacterium]
MTRVERIINEVAQLEPAERAEVVERLLESAPLEMDEEIETAWKDEVRERLARVRAGKAKLIPWEESKRRLLAR